MQSVNSAASQALRSFADTLWCEQRAMGGVLPDEEADVPETYRFCCPPVVHFGNLQQEYQAARSGAVLFDFSDRTQIEITGQDRQPFLHNFCTNNIKRLECGESCEAFVTSAKGRILAHIFAFVGADSLWIETTPGRAEALLAHLDRYIIRADVQLYDRTGDYGELFFTGPETVRKLAAINLLPKALDVHQHSTIQRATPWLAVRRVDLLGQPGVFLVTTRAQLGAVWKELIAAGAYPGGAAAFHACRIEAGFPLYGLDLSDDNLAQEAARTETAISFTKGCYLGQEPIARIDTLGHVNRKLCALRLTSKPVPGLGDVVLSEQGREVGVITSSALVPGEDRPIALGLLRTSHTGPATEVRVRIGDIQIGASVCCSGRA
ncbi:MAG: hypothetical protein A2W31_15395 [Planctomycetes bacterium RBG_16_64_10]|nr:MAG: hypothetical protein A2W31_15395 [Planctomycetes bacterium RBG_16_64_10]